VVVQTEQVNLSDTISTEQKDIKSIDSCEIEKKEEDKEFEQSSDKKVVCI